MVNLVKHDLEFILKQIKIAEAHADGGDLAELVGSPLAPYGLRTVDGSYNNLVPGREEWGAADSEFPPLTALGTPANDADGDVMSFGSGLGAPSPVTNTDYGVSGDLADADPRLISNLIVDQTNNNPIATQLYERYLAEGLTVTATPLLEDDGVTQKLAADGSPLVAYHFENISPDIGDSAPYNTVFTIFGQFFDHGLDHVAKGGSGTIYMPLSPDDPLYVENGHANFMALTRASTGDGAKNTTTPWVDQNQTYGSHASVQVFLREYELDAEDRPIATGNLLHGAQGGMATWADIKAQAATKLGILLTDKDVDKVPLIAADEYGNFIPGDNGFAQLVTGLGPDGQFGTADDVLTEGDPNDPVDPTVAGAARTGHAFLLDIAHNAAPGMYDSNGDHIPDAAKVIDGDVDAGGVTSPQPAGTYDNELLDAHFIAGDGRANENVGLTTIHHIFHSEHNLVVNHAKEVIAGTGDISFIAEWFVTDGKTTAEVTSAVQAWLDDGADPLAPPFDWNGDRLFQAGRFTTEMEYQHLVFEEFARKMQPDVDAFLFEPDPDINPAIFAEFANVVYRFGHSMLNETIDRVDAEGNPIHLDLFDAFLNPLIYDEGVTLTHDEAAGAILRGMSVQAGNEIDEFVTNVLRNQLVGIPLDLAAINIARGRDTGMPTLNEAREQLQAAAGGDSQLEAYTGWRDFALNMKNPESIVNFIAAYGTHALIAGETTLEGKRAAAMAIVFNSSEIVYGANGAGDNRLINAPADRLDFLNGTGDYAHDLGGLSNVDMWMGGLAERKMDFGGMLGSTFSAVFELQMENLQDGDRFYYLSRAQGLNLLSELEGNSLAKMALRNTDLGETGTAIGGDIFATPDHALYMDIVKQIAMTGLDDPRHENATLEAISNLVDRRNTDDAPDTDYMRYNGVDHVVMQGSIGDDTLIGGEGDDSLWGGDGDDRLDGGYGIDHVHGGDGDDIITNSGSDIGAADFLHGEEGNDVIHGGAGLTLMFGNQGQDFMVAGSDGKTVMGGIDNDFILGGDGMDFLLGEAGDDWLEGGGRFDTLAGENSEIFFNSSIIGHDVLNGQHADTDYDAESGDDIMVQGVGIQRSNGMAGFDWAIHKGDVNPANSDLGIPIFATQEDFILRDRFDLVEGLSGWIHDDVLTGRVANVNTRAELTGTAAIPGPDSILDSYSSALLEKNVSLIAGLDKIVAHSARTTETGNDGTVETIAFQSNDASDILLGGGGSDKIKGLAGNDVIDGDKWLNARIAAYALDTMALIATADGMTGKLYKSAEGLAAKNAEDLYNPDNVGSFAGMTLDQAVFNRVLNPGQLKIVREIVDGNQAGDIDTAVYTGMRTDYGFGVNTDGSLYVDHAPSATDETDVLGDNIEGVTEKPILDGRDTIRNIERLDFLDLDMNVINGTANSETLNGNVDGSGLIHDVIMGFGGNDTLNGLSGDDVLIGGAGNDTLNGGSGDDIYVLGLNDGVDTIHEEGDGADKISIAAVGVALSALNFRREADGDMRIDLNGQRITVSDHFTNPAQVVETVSFDSGSYGGYDFYLADDEGDELFRGTYVLGTDADGELTADADIDTILADQNGSFATTLTGNSGDDMLFGNGGSDILNGGAGVDLLVGGGGADTYIVDDLGDTVVELASGGTDTVQTSLPSYTLDTNVERLASTGAGEFTGAGNELDNVITGGAGSDSLYGVDGDDRLVGGDGDDFLSGGTGEDTLNGGDGNDAINGGLGNDLINLGAGFNTVIYDQIVFGADVVRSFDANPNGGGQDKIDLSGLGITVGTFSASVTISIVGSDTVIAAGGGTITLVGVTGVGQNSIDQSDFILAGNTVIDGDGADNTLDGTAGNDILNGLGGNDTVNGLAGNDTIDGGVGDDILNGGSGDDTILWTAPEAGSGGWDVVDGGSEGIDGDTFIITGNSSYEIFRFYPAEDAELVVPGLVLKGGSTEIVVTRTTVVAGVETDTIVIAELSEIEEIIVDGASASGVGTGGTGDRFELIGDFAEQGEETSLRTSTITVIGSEGDDTVDISSLMSAHRIVFKTKGGNDTIIGTLRPQDVIELEDGKSLDDYVVASNADGSTTISSGTHTVTFYADADAMQQFEMPGEGGDILPFPGTDDDDVVTLPADQDAEEEGDEVEDDEEGRDDDDEDEDEDEDEEEDDDVLAPPAWQDDDDEEEAGSVVPAAHAGTYDTDVLNGTDLADHLIGFAGDDVLIGQGGNDVLVGGAGDDFLAGWVGDDTIHGDAGNDTIIGGDGNDMIYGNEGADRILADAGNDLVDAGAGNDSVVGGAGDDIFTAGTNDGDDVYFGDELNGGNGIDLLDMRTVSSDTTVDLGSGMQGLGSAVSATSGHDTLWGIENVATGSGADTITASNAVNVIDGGAGDDTFRFKSISAADGDTIVGFEAGDKLDLSMIDADGTASFGNQSFTLRNGAESVAQLAIGYETRDDGNFTVIKGYVTDAGDADFTINIEGTHTLTAGNFDL